MRVESCQRFEPMKTEASTTHHHHTMPPLGITGRGCLSFPYPTPCHVDLYVNNCDLFSHSPLYNMSFEFSLLIYFFSKGYDCGINKRSHRRGSGWQRRRMWGSPPATNTSKITSTRGKSFTESQLETGRSFPGAPGLQDSSCWNWKDREETAGVNLYSWEETKRKREIRGSKQAKPQTSNCNPGSAGSEYYIQIYTIHSHYMQK